MPEYGTKKEEIKGKLRRKINREGKSEEQAVSEVRKEGDYSQGYVTEVYEKFIATDAEPRTDTQKAVIEAYDEDPKASYKVIARKAAEIGNLDSVPDQSTVSDYTQRFRNDMRRDVQSYTEPEHIGQKSNGDHNPEYVGSIFENGVQVDADNVDELASAAEGDEDDGLITITLDEEKAFDLARKLVQDGEMEDVAKEVMRQYR